MDPSINVLSPHVRKVIKILVNCIVPPAKDFAPDDIEDKIIRDSERMVFELPKLTRLFFILGVHLFDWLPFLSGLGFSRFTRLSAEKRIKYVDSWAHSKQSFKREFFKALKTIITLTYFSDSRVWDYLGYDPAPHVVERIQLRKTILS